MTGPTERVKGYSRMFGVERTSAAVSATRASYSSMTVRTTSPACMALERLVDAVEPGASGDHGLEVELPAPPEAQETVEVGAHVGGAVEGAFEVLLVEEELERVELHELVHAPDAHHDHVAPTPGGVERGADGDGMADGLEGVVEAGAARELTLRARRDRRASPRAVAPNCLAMRELPVDQVDGDDFGCSGDARALDHADAHAAAAEDHHR